MEALDAAHAPGPISPSQRKARTADAQRKCIDMICVPENGTALLSTVVFAWCGNLSERNKFRIYKRPSRALGFSWTPNCDENESEITRRCV